MHVCMYVWMDGQMDGCTYVLYVSGWRWIQIDRDLIQTINVDINGYRYRYRYRYIDIDIDIDIGIDIDIDM